MNLAIKSEEDLVKIINDHFNSKHSFQDCLNILDSRVLKQSRGILNKNNRELLTKLEVLNEPGTR